MLIIVISKKQILFSGVGIASGVGLLYLLFKDLFGFGDTPVDLWRNTSINTRGRIAHNRPQNRDLKSVATARTEWSEVESIRKQRKEDAAVAAEARRREAIWRRTRRKIDSN